MSTLPMTNLAANHTQLISANTSYQNWGLYLSVPSSWGLCSLDFRWAWLMVNGPPWIPYALTAVSSLSGSLQQLGLPWLAGV